MPFNLRGALLVVLVILNQIVAWSIAGGIVGLLQLTNDPVINILIAMCWSMVISITLPWSEWYMF